MLLRWLVNNYLRDAAEGKVREAVAGVLSERREPRLQAPASAPSEIASDEPSAAPAEYLPCDVLFVFALGMESGGLVDLLQGLETSRHAHGVEHAGRLGSREVAIVETGVGSAAAAKATAAAIRFYRPRWVVSAGFAGALVENLRRGHIVLADSVANQTGEELATGLKLSAPTSPSVHVGRLVTVADIIRRPAQRQKLALERRAVACDMETFAVAKTCQDLATPMMSVRIISDALEDELPPEIERLLAQKTLAGQLGAVAGAIFKRWSAAKDLWQLREDALKASDRLAKFLASLVQQMPAS